ncbi:hypothetical protein PN36_34950, partial [Candidatus Thiomargarita nelsonii]
MSHLSSISQQALEAFVGNQEQEASPEEKPSEKEILPTEEEASALPSKEEETEEVSSEEAPTEDMDSSEVVSIRDSEGHLKPFKVDFNNRDQIKKYVRLAAGAKRAKAEKQQLSKEL